MTAHSTSSYARIVAGKCYRYWGKSKMRNKLSSIVIQQIKAIYQINRSIAEILAERLFDPLGTSYSICPRNLSKA